MMSFLVVMFLCCIAEIQRCEQGEYICLKKCYQKFDKIHEDHEGRGENTHAKSRTCALFTKDEDERSKGQDDDVTRIDVGRESDHQYSRLDEYAHQFNWHKNKLNSEWNTGRPYDVTPVMRIAID